MAPRLQRRSSHIATLGFEGNQRNTHTYAQTTCDKYHVETIQECKVYDDLTGKQHT